MAALMPSLVPARPADDSATRTAPEEDALAPAPPAPLALRGAVLPRGPDVLAAVVGALVHLHFLKVLELDARLGLALGSRDPAVLGFLALPLVLPALAPVTGTPLGGLGGAEPFDAQTRRRWAEYTDHLEELVPRDAVENLLATLAPAIVQPS